MFKISLSRLNNDQLYTLAFRTIEVIQPYPVKEMGIELFFNNLSKEFKKFAKAREKLAIDGKVLGGLDKTRDVYYNNMNSHLQNYLDYPDEDIKQQTKALLNEINRHGTGVAKRRYKDETAILQTIIAKISAEFLDLMDKSHNVWFNLLVGAQTAFEQKFHELSGKKVDSNKIESPTDLRPDVEEGVRKLYSFMPLQLELTGNENLKKIIELLEEELKRF